MLWKQTFLAVILGFSFLSPLLFNVESVNQVQASKNVLSSLADESDNVDSFDVHPDSGRWNVTTDTRTDDLITDSTLRLETVNNQSSGDSEFAMDRGLRKTDGKVEYRSKVDAGGNQTEYFRDQIGDSVDFEEDDEAVTAFSGADSITQSNGILTVTRTSSDSTWGFRKTFEALSPIVYNSIEFRIKGTGTEQTNLRFEWLEAVGGSPYSTVVEASDLPSEWTIYTVDLSAISAWTSRPKIEVIDILAGTTSSGEYQLEYVKLIGDLDYATHAESEIEDTIDFEDSLEYFYDTFDNISDFDDGTTENWTSYLGSTVSHATGGYLNISDTDTGLGTVRTSLSIDSSIYKWFTMEFNPSQTINQINIRAPTADIVCSDATGWAASSWHLLSCDLSADGDWSGTETEIAIQFIAAAAVASYIHVNFTFLYDVELGDLEAVAGNKNPYVNPNGYFTTTLNAGGASFFALTTNTNINPELFDYFTIRMKSFDSTLDFQLYTNGGTVSESHIDFLNSDWNVYSFSFNDLWTGEIDYINIRLDEQDETLEGTELLLIDYILLTGNYDETDNVIGFYDSNSDVPLVNITTHFWEQTDDSYYPSSASLRFEIEILDESQEIAFYYYSDNYTTLHEEFIYGKLTYNVLESDFIVEIKGDNDTRIFRITYPKDFTSSSGRTPALFNLGQAPSVFISTYCKPISWQLMTIDFITAPFKEREWTQTTTPSDSDWYGDSWQFGTADGAVDANEQSTWRLTVPMLDSATGQLRIEYKNPASLDTFDLCRIDFSIYAVDSIDGSLTTISVLSLYHGNTTAVIASVPDTPFFLMTTSGKTVYENASGQNPSYNPTLSFSYSITEERSVLNSKVRFQPDEDNASNFLDIADELRFVDDAIVTNPSQEFVLEITYVMAMSDPSTFNPDGVILELNDFELLERDIFGEIVGLIPDPVGDAAAATGNFLSNIFKEVGKFIGGVFKGVGDLIVFAIDSGLGVVTSAVNAVTAAVAAVESAVNSVVAAVTALPAQIDALLQASLGAAIDAVSTAVGLVESAIDSLKTALETAIEAVESAVDAVTDAVNSAVSFLSDLYDIFISFIADILADFLTFIEDEFFPWIITAMFGIWDDIWTPILNLVGLKAFVDGIMQADYATYVTDFVGMFTAVAKNMKWLVVAAIFFVFTLSFLMTQDSRGKINGFQGLGNMVNNGFRSGITTPDTSLLGFSLGRIMIPLILIIYIALKVLIASGELPDIFGGLPI